MEAKEKKCKGTGKAIGYGCGKLTLWRRYGLCRRCFADWLYNSAAGKESLLKLTIRAKKKTEKEKKKELKKEKRQKKIELMGVDKYRAEILQPIINEIARLIDYQCPCIASGLYEGKQSGGHYHSVGSNRTIALNLHNIHVQSFYSNCARGGDNIRYRNGLIRTYGQEYMDMVESLSKISSIHLTKQELIEIKKKASAIRLELKANLKYRTPKERIQLREKINKKLGIYY